MPSVYPTVTLFRAFASETWTHVLDCAALVQRENTVYYVCLGTDERAGHMMRDDLISGWLK